MLEIFCVFKKMFKLLIKLIIFFFFSEISSKEIYSCSITAEIENYEEAKKKIYKKKN